jgi:LacI family transcriptional regulator
MIGLILPCITNPFYMELAKAVETEAYRQGFKLILCEAGQSIEKEEEFIHTLACHNIAGIITATGNYIEPYNNSPFVVMSIDKKIAPDIVNIGSDNLKGGALAISHLAECGCKKILFIRQEKDIEALNDRQNGALNMAGKLGVEMGLLAVPEANSEWVLDENHEILRDYDGIFAWNDMTAISVLRTCHTHGIRVPEDMMVVGYDNISLSRLMIPSLTTVAQKIYLMGHMSAHLLLNMVQGKEVLSKDILLDVELLKRESTRW